MNLRAPDFVECPTCAAKPGAPTLCETCQANREAVRYWRRRAQPNGPPPKPDRLPQPDTAKRGGDVVDRRLLVGMLVILLVYLLGGFAVSISALEACYRAERVER